MRWRRWLLAAAALAVLVLAAAYVMVEVLGVPFGLSPGYRARDHDLRLTAIARTALPIIAALDQYHAARGAYPEANDAEGVSALAKFLPASVTIGHAGGNFVMFDIAQMAVPRTWIYYRARNDTSAYSLSFKLGWDPKLIYQRAGSASQWVFDPGDGSDEKVIALTP